MDNKVTIIIPIYNVSQYIERCARSLFEQTYANIEYVFVDDCTPDDSMEILDRLVVEYPERLKNVQIVKHEVNKGLPAARNTGMARATGEYIYHCDSDDWLSLDLVKCMVERINETKADIVFCDFYTIYSTETITTNLNGKASFAEYLNGFCEGSFPGNVFNKLVRRDLYVKNNVRFPDGYSMLEDLRTTIQLFYYADKISYCAETLYYYVRDIATSISGSNYTKSVTLSKDRVENVRGIEAFLIEKGVPNIEDNILKLKLGAKHNLLINSKDIKTYALWRDTFPESNKAVWKSDLPIHYKCIAFFATYRIWPMLMLWTKVKYNLFKK